MAWSPLSARLVRLPLVIAGPILRRVEPRLVSVWIALRQPVFGARLRVMGPSGSPDFTGEAADTVALGANLYVGLLTAVPPNGIELVAGVVYRYDIGMGSRGALGSPGIVSASGDLSDIAYGSHGLPSFVLPGNAPSSLRLVHGSCRKPHGGKTDALRALDAILEASNADPAVRPQQLILTGDQIYADDVADSLLFMLMDAAPQLLGWEQLLPEAIPAAENAPGRRQGAMERANFTSGEARSHLIRLGEFYAMYLFAWSPILWPEGDDLPAFEQVFPPPASMHEVIAPSGMSADAGVPSEPRRIPTDDYRLHGTQQAALMEFRRSLPFVRRALANIACYMMFDDHEVTDDWFLTKTWCDRTLQPSLGRRILQNALCAFAVFQAWGNTPDRFRAGSPGGALLEQLQAVNASGGTSFDEWEEIGATLLPRMTDGGPPWRLEGGMNWAFAIDFTGYQLVALDTRTRRGFHSTGGPSNLISSAAFDDEIPLPHPGHELAIVVAPAPVIGHALLERFIQPLVGTFSPPAADFEAWILAPWTLEELLRRLVPYRRVVIVSGDVHYAFSAGVHYWDDRGPEVRRAAFAQLCASSLKNSTDRTGFTAGPFMAFPGGGEFLGWDEPGYHILDVGVSPEEQRFVRGRPAVHELRSTTERIGTDPQWRYRVRFERDDRRNADRGLPPPATFPTSGRQYDAARHRALVDFGMWQRLIVGQDNLGMLTFEWSGDDQTVVHDLWYVPNIIAAESSLLRPYTRHRVSLTPPSATAPRPGERP